MKKLLIVLAVLTTMLTACDDNKDAVVTIHTEYGDMKAILYNETPLHKKNFLELAKSGRYDSTTWHRIIKNFMIQGGNVNAKEGTREAEEDRIPAEIVDGFYHTKGALAAARQGDQVNPEKKSSATQFYIVHGKVWTKNELTVDQVKLNQGISKLLSDPKFEELTKQFQELSKARDFDAMNELALENKELVEQELGIDLNKDFDADRLELYTSVGGAPHLDSEYTVFGRVVEGLDVIDKIAAVETGRMDKPVKDTYMTMEVELIPKKKITEMYGYEYPEEEK
ncbi:MAG: peptidylprolyl isomerase [Cyclobacteriaceae bacterium]